MSSSYGSGLEDDGGLIEIQAGVARVELAGVSAAQVAEKVDLPFAVGEKFGVYFVGADQSGLEASFGGGRGEENEPCRRER